MAGEGTESGNGEERPGPGAHSSRAGHQVELPKDVWGVIWDKLSQRELAKVATVAKAWRDFGVERGAKRRAAALARVTAPDHVPNCDLSAPQRIFRAIKRHLQGQDAFTGEPVQSPGEEDERYKSCVLADGEDDVRPLQLDESRSSCEWRLWVYELERHLANLSMVWAEPAPGQEAHDASTCIEVELTFKPGSPHESEWMQGLLLALSKGSLGDPVPSGGSGAGAPPLRGHLARCTSLLVVRWRRRRNDSMDVLFLTMFQNVWWQDGGPRDVVARISWNRGADKQI